MRILIVNYRYFVSGGPERYMFNVMPALSEYGHKVAPFSIHYRRNEATPFSKYFVDPLGTRDEIYFRDQRMTPKTLFRTMQGLFYSKEVEMAIKRLILDFKPHVAYVLHYMRKLSPSLLVGLKSLNIPIVVRLSDYAMVCPQNHCLRKGKACQLCVEGNILPSIFNRCVNGSTMASILNAIASWYHRYRQFFDLIDIFITTNKFMFDMMVKAGFPERRLAYIPTFVNTKTFQPQLKERRQQYIACIGRLEKIKGIHILIDAIGIIRRRRPGFKLKVKIAGDGDQGYVQFLENKIKNQSLGNIVELLGRVDTSSISALLRNAQFSVIPSLCYENMPNTLLESYACGTPVIASDTGSLTESVQEGRTGFLFCRGDSSALADCIEKFMDQPQLFFEMSRNARRLAETKHSLNKHVEALEKHFQKLKAV